MSLCKSLATLLLSIFIIGAVASKQNVFAQTASADSSAAAQAEKAEKEDETNLDTQLYLVVATNQEVDDSKLPAAIEPLMKQLRQSLPFKNYRLAATLINRVKNNGRLNLKWVGGPLGVTATPSINPSFNEFKVVGVKLTTDAAGQPVVRMDGFSFGARIPIQIGAVASSGPAAVPVINYESTGLSTDISMREGEPVVVGTLNIGPSGDAIILVMSAKRSAK
jgi:hypothetical protein